MEFITKDDIIYDIVKKYPELKKILPEISSTFKKLENPLLFNTVAKFTTVEKAAKIGKVYLKEMLYKLNESIGKEKEYFDYEKKQILKIKDKYLKNRNKSENKVPDWLEKSGNFKIFDARNYKKDPFADIIDLAKKINLHEGFILVQSFEPLPLISFLSNNGFENFVKKIDDNNFKIYFYKTKLKNI